MNFEKVQVLWEFTKFERRVDFLYEKLICRWSVCECFEFVETVFDSWKEWGRKKKKWRSKSVERNAKEPKVETTLLFRGWNAGKLFYIPAGFSSVLSQKCAIAWILLFLGFESSAPFYVLNLTILLLFNVTKNTAIFSLLQNYYIIILSGLPQTNVI